MKPGTILKIDEQLDYAILAKERVEIRMGDRTEYVGVLLSRNNNTVKVRNGFFIKENIEIRTI